MPRRSTLAADTQTANNRAVVAVRNSVSVRCADLAVKGDGSRDLAHGHLTKGDPR